MIFRLLLYLIGFFALVVVPFAGVGYGAYLLIQKRRRAPERIKREMGRRNAIRMRSESDETCSFCSKKTHAVVDVYDDRIGWYHPSCYKRLMDDV